MASECDVDKLDFCEHSVTLDDNHKSIANHQFGTYLKALQQAAHGFPVPKNIYLGGSLALQEPAMRFSNGTCCGVYSDLDLFVITQAVTDIPKLASLPSQTESVLPDLERSFHFAPLIKPQKNLYVVTLEDLGPGMERPVINEIDINNSHYRIMPKSKSMARMLVARMCNYCLPWRNTTHAYTNLGDQNKAKKTTQDTIKLVLNALRLQCYGKTDARRFADLLPLAEKGYFHGLMETSEIESWIFCRERYDEKKALPQLNIERFIYKAWSKAVNIDSKAAINTLLETVEHRYFFENNTLDQLALLLLCFCLYQMSPDWERLFYLEEMVDRFIANTKNDDTASQLCKKIKQALSEKTMFVSVVIDLYNRYMSLTTESIVSDYT